MNDHGNPGVGAAASGPEELVRPYLPTREAAAYAGVSARTLEGLRRYRKGPAFIRWSGRGVVYRREDVDAWLSAHRITCDAQVRR